MTQEYVPVDCSWPWHPKVISLSLAARGLWISALCYAGTNDGVIPYSVVERFAPRLKLGHLIEELESIGLWETHESGWSVHDFAEHCSWLSKRRERDRDRQRRRRESLGASRDSHTQVTPEHEQGTVNKEQRTPSLPPLGDVRQVFDVWVESTGHKACKLDDKRIRVVRARLADYPLDDLLDAVRGWERDPWEGRRRQNELTILLRDASQVEKFRDLWRQPRLVSSTGEPEHYAGPTPLAQKYWNAR